MSQQLLCDVDERISAIKSSLRQITTNIEGTPSSDHRHSISSKQLTSSLKKTSPKSQKKQKKTSYVSNYVAFGDQLSSESSSDECENSKKVKFDPASSIWFEKSLNFNEEIKQMTGKSNEIVEFELLLNYEKNKSNNLEIELQEKNEENKKLKETCSKLTEVLANKDKEKEEYLELIERLKLEIVDLNKHIERYQGLIKEFEEIQVKYSEKEKKNEIYLKFEAKIEELNLENQEFQQKLQIKEAEFQYLQNTNRELARHNNHLEKALEKLSKEKIKISESDQKQHKQKIETLKEEIKSLKQINENLKDELKKKPNDSIIKETEKKLQELERQVDEFCSKKKQGNSKNESSNRKIIGSLLNLLKITKSSEILGKVQELIKTPGHGESQKISKKIKNLIVKYSPPGTFSKFPGDKKVYSWIKRLIEEYLMKVKENEYFLQSHETVKSLMKMFNVTFAEDLIQKVGNLMNKFSNN